MSAIDGETNEAQPENRSARRFRRRREKIFGIRYGLPLDQAAKKRIYASAEAWSGRHRTKGQHRGPLTRATMEVLETLLWGFHNTQDGRCFPSYEAIAKKARCCRDTVHKAIHALEAAEILTWVNRIVREKHFYIDPSGRRDWRYRVVRTSNAYMFRDPLPCQAASAILSRKAASPAPLFSMSENRSGTPTKDFICLSTASKVHAFDPKSMIDKALLSLGQQVVARPEAKD